VVGARAQDLAKGTTAIRDFKIGGRGQKKNPKRENATTLKKKGQLKTVRGGLAKKGKMLTLEKLDNSGKSAQPQIAKKAKICQTQKTKRGIEQSRIKHRLVRAKGKRTVGRRWLLRGTPHPVGKICRMG